MADEKWRKDMEYVKLLQDIIPQFNGDKNQLCAFVGKVKIAVRIASQLPDGEDLVLNVVKSRISGPISNLVSDYDSVDEILKQLRYTCFRS